MFSVASVVALPTDIDSLAAVAADEGFRMVSRLAAEYRLGDNRFDGPGEALWAARAGGELIAVCGLNRDPFADPAENAGRVRRLYVRPEWRRCGIASELVDAVVARARTRFSILTAFTTNESARAFYVARGFDTVDGVPRRSLVLALASL